MIIGTAFLKLAININQGMVLGDEAFCVRVQCSDNTVLLGFNIENLVSLAVIVAPDNHGCTCMFA